MDPDAIRQFVAEQEDMELGGDCRGPMKILQETGRLKADAVIFAQEGADEPGLCSQLLAVYPDLAILSVTPDLTSAFTLQLCSHRREFTNLQRQDIVQSLRAECEIHVVSEIIETSLTTVGNVAENTPTVKERDQAI